MSVDPNYLKIDFYRQEACVRVPLKRIKFCLAQANETRQREYVYFSEGENWGKWEYLWKCWLNKGKWGHGPSQLPTLLWGYKQTPLLCSSYVTTRESTFIHERKCLWHLWSSDFPLWSSFISLEISYNFNNTPDIIFSSFHIISLLLLWCFFFQSIKHLKNDKALPRTLQWDYEHNIITPENTWTVTSKPFTSI